MGEYKTHHSKIREEAANYEGTHGELVVYPLYSSLPPQQQQKIFLVRACLLINL